MRAAAFVASVAFLSGAALAQPASDPPPPTGESPAVDVGTPRAAPTSEAPEQISTSAESSPTEAQLTTDRASHQQPAQLSSGTPSAQAPELSRPAEGRTAAVEPVTGADRCDPAIAKDKQSDLCRKVIESRADEYTRPAPTELSPEQKLLLAQQWGATAADVADAANRLAKSGSPTSSTDALGVASIVLQQSQPTAPDDQKKDQQDPASNPEVQAIIQALTQAPPQN